MYQNNHIKEANNPREAATYWCSWYLCTILEVWYKMEPEANTIIPTLNHSPRLNPNKVPATIRPKAIKNPMVNADFKKEKSFLVINTIADNAVNKDMVKIAAW